MIITIRETVVAVSGSTKIIINYFCRVCAASLQHSTTISNRLIKGVLNPNF